jgi:hypothetical protein
MIALDSLRIEPGVVRQQLDWLMTHSGVGEADGLAALLETLLARATLGRKVTRALGPHVIA